jgi:uncharacterized protein YdhG (YjbR/CyaY superfamily)
MTRPVRTSRARPAAAEIRAYLAGQPPPVRRQLANLRAAIRSAAPAAVEVFSYGIPGFRLDGRALVWYAGWKQHTSLYPVGDAIKRAFAPRLDAYASSKGSLRFPIANPPSATLVKKLVKARIAQVRLLNSTTSRRPASRDAKDA